MYLNLLENPVNKLDFSNSKRTAENSDFHKLNIQKYFIRINVVVFYQGDRRNLPTQKIKKLKVISGIGVR